MVARYVRRQDDFDISEPEDSKLAVSEDPIKWELLHDYLRSLPTRVRIVKVLVLK